MKLIFKLKELKQFSQKSGIAVIIVLFVLCTIQSAFAQNITVSGWVKNKAGEAIPGVTIAVKGTANGTVSNLDGNFSIGNISSDAVLVFSFIGMKTQEVVVGGKTTINIVMEEETIGIEEVVAIGYGTMKKSDLTGSVASVKGEDLAEIPVATVAQALQGRTAGVLIQQQTGAPGSAIQIRIRGNNSIMGSNEPLWVVDGFPVSSANMVN
jgi:hypothetical protein